MKSSKAFALMAVLALVGCNKKAEPSAVSTDTVPQGEAVASSAASQPLPPPPVHIAAQAQNSVQARVTGVADAFLTSQLRIFVKDKGRLPQSFTEFARTRLDSVPRAPEGCQWVIDSATMEVKSATK